MSEFHLYNVTCQLFKFNINKVHSHSLTSYNLEQINIIKNIKTKISLCTSILEGSFIINRSQKLYETQLYLIVNGLV